MQLKLPITVFPFTEKTNIILTKKYNPKKADFGLHIDYTTQKRPKMGYITNIQLMEMERQNHEEEVLIL